MRSSIEDETRDGLVHHTACLGGLDMSVFQSEIRSRLGVLAKHGEAVVLVSNRLIFKEAARMQQTCLYRRTNR